MSSSSSSPKNTTSTSTSVKTTNQNVSGNAGVTLFADSGGAASLTDNSSTYNITSSAQSDKALADVAEQTISASVGLSQNALDTARASADDTSNFAAKALASTQDTLLSLNGAFVNAVSSFEATSQSQLGNTVSALNEISKEQNQSTDQLLASTLQNVFKNVAYGLIAAGLIWVLVNHKSVV